MLLNGVGQVALTSACDTHGTTIGLHKGRQQSLEVPDDLSDVLGINERPVCTISRHMNFPGQHCFDAESVKGKLLFIKCMVYSLKLLPAYHRSI